MKNIKLDFLRYGSKRPPNLLVLLLFSLTNPGFNCVMIFRMQNAILNRGMGIIARMLRSWNLMITGADISPGAEIGPGLLIQHPSGIVIGQGVKIGANCTVLHQVTLGEKYANSSGDHLYPTIGDSCVLGAGSKLLGSVVLGANVTIGANSLVLSNVPANSTAVGIPARVV